MADGSGLAVSRGRLTLAPRVLLVDDDVFLLSAFTHFLQPVCEIATSESAVQALEMLAGHHFDVVATDYRMPERDGVWLLERLREACPEVGRVLISGAPPENLATLVTQGLIDQFHQKPLRPQSFSDALQRLALANQRNDPRQARAVAALTQLPR